MWRRTEARYSGLRRGLAAHSVCSLPPEGRGVGWRGMNISIGSNPLARPRYARPTSPLRGEVNSRHRLAPYAALIALPVLGLASASNAAQADPVAEFYRGRQVNLILSADAGGGYASYANAFAPYFGNHIPG